MNALNATYVTTCEVPRGTRESTQQRYLRTTIFNTGDSVFHMEINKMGL